MKRIGQKGYSLVEALVVIAIIAIVAAIAIPNLQRYAANSRLKNAARDIMGDIFLCRERAISENVQYRIQFNITNNSYTIEQPAGTVIQTKSPSSFADDIRLIQNIPTACYAGASTTFNVTTVDFQTRGTMNPTTGTILLTNNRGSTATITYNITGRTHVCFLMQ
ncbi:hypothetical protein A45J_0031 [hot springs metagenome]|uniref:General secretion pathway GspH domain-containing protein n=1 Tax=hot springs metagenome TaxID=433727 RepID=A0A5J4L4B9_9ZZZZ